MQAEKEGGSPLTGRPVDRDVGHLDWDSTNDVRLDGSIVFGLGYDFFGLENLRLEARGPNGNYLMWPNGGKWSLYRDTDGALAFERYGTVDECKAAAERWCADVTPNMELTGGAGRPDQRAPLITSR